MAEDLYSFTKDVFIIKPPKKSPLALRMIVLVFAMVCGVYICSICLKQISTHSKGAFFDVPELQKPCPEPQIEPWEIPYVHYPRPSTYSRAECACKPVRYFVILSMQRSGSGWFETLLNNHTNISSNGEVFSVKVRRSNISTIVETLDTVYNLEWFSSASKNECTAAVGLKWMLNQSKGGLCLLKGLLIKLVDNGDDLDQMVLSVDNQCYYSVKRQSPQYIVRNDCEVLQSVPLNSLGAGEKSVGPCDPSLPSQQTLGVKGLMQHHAEIAEYFRTRGVSVIFLFRRNLLRRMISVLANLYDRNAKLLNGTHKSHVHSPHEAEILANYKPIINATLLIPNLKQVEETTAKALEYFKSTRHIVLYYEDIVRNHTKLIDVQDFLKVPHRELKSRQVKIHRGSLSSQIKDWDDVQKALEGTPYERFLNTDY
ncbi:hypothetical protein CJ030_MR7G011437 [Morella rubra]|uniref:Sulfotransferase n=1 Tax=Morella rubra TaxID=262757 RepID=A0A6A1V4H1_9ROSI|nr:hypothetical protein CJ030_MR7G011437 [Morella rubra]